MQSITEVTIFFASLMAAAAVVVLVLAGVLAGMVVSRRHSIRPQSGSVTAPLRQSTARGPAVRPRRTAHHAV